MNYFVQLLKTLTAILFLCYIVVIAQSYKSVVKGRIIDDKGNPVKNALVSLESLPENEIDLFSYDETVYTDKEGKFMVENTSKKFVRKRNLFVSGSFPENSISLVDLPPSTNFRLLKPNLRVMSINLTGESLIDVGDILIKVGVGLVEISVVSRDGKPYFETEKDWQSSFYVLRGENGKLYVARGISGKDTELKVDLKEGLIRFAIAEGIWQLEFISDLANLKSVIVKTDKFCVKRDEKLKLRLVVTDEMINQITKNNHNFFAH